AEAGMENETHGLVFRQFLGFCSRNRSGFNRAADDLLRVDAATVIGDFDDHLIALMIGIKMNGAEFRFAKGLAFVGRLDAVVHCVADEVRQRFGESVENAFVEVGGFAGDLDGSVSATRFCDVADNSREAAEKLFDGNHADFDHRALELFEDAGLDGQSVSEAAAQRIFGVALVEFDYGAMKHGLADDEFADEIEDGVDAFGIDTQSTGLELLLRGSSLVGHGGVGDCDVRPGWRCGICGGCALSSGFGLQNYVDKILRWLAGAGNFFGSDRGDYGRNAAFLNQKVA